MADHLLSTHRRCLAVLAAATLAVWPVAVRAHDASSWGGLFRSRDGGETWFQASTGKVMGGALGVAIHPADSNQLLLATDSGLLVSRNGGLDWDLVATDVLVGPVLAVAFDAGGRSILAASASGLAESDDGQHWQSRTTPAGASPTRMLAAGSGNGAFFLVGWHGLYGTADRGATWTELDSGLPGESITRLLVSGTAPGTLLVVAAGDIWLSDDGGLHWQPRRSGLQPGRIQTAALDARQTQTVWAAGADRMFRSDDLGFTWRAAGEPLPDDNTDIRQIAVDSDDPRRFVLSTHRGLYATHDGGTTWQVLVDNLPGHVEAGPLVRDRSQSATLYAGFSVTPYDEAWRNAAAGGSALRRLAPSELVGAAALLLLIGLAATLSLRWLARRPTLAGEPAR